LARRHDGRVEVHGHRVEIVIEQVRVHVERLLGSFLVVPSGSGGRRTQSASTALATFWPNLMILEAVRGGASLDAAAGAVVMARGMKAHGGVLPRLTPPPAYRPDKWAGAASALSLPGSAMSTGAGM
jgi:hypothetical protein